MKSIVICEKPSQAANVRAAVGNQFGEVLAAQGHLLRLQSPEEENPEWATWGTAVLRPKSGQYRLAADTNNGKRERFRAIRDALKSAKRVIIATDADREGQAIGQSLLEFCGYKGEVLRAMFTAEDPATIRSAFHNARPNKDYHRIYSAAVARQQSDQVFNLSLTRAATVNLVPKGVRAVIGIGRVRTPTLGIVCRRELELATFKPRPYFDLSATVESGGKRANLTYRPRDDDRIFDRALAQALADGVSGWQGPIAVKQETKHQAPPRPADLPTLQKRAAKWGWPAKKTLEVAQALYETHKVTTYPRASTRYLPEAMEAPAVQAFEGLVKAGLAGNGTWPAPTIRKGKAGTFSDKALAGESHHAIIPNPAVAADFETLVAKLDPDERKLFDAIASAFLSSIGPDHIYDRTEFSITVETGGRQFALTTAGNITRQAGWKAIGATDDEDGDKDEEANTLPDFQNGEPVTVTSAAPVEKTTTAPARYDEGTLIEAMQNAWKFVEDPAERDRLKEAKGIGTAATRDTIIEGLKRQELLTVTKGKLFAPEAALQLYRLLVERCPELVDPGATARLEADLDLIVTGETECQQVIDAACDRAGRLIAILSAGNGETLALKRPPTDGMIEAAKRKASREGGRVPAEVLKDYDACRTWLGPMPERGDGEQSGPSPAQLALAEKIATATGAALSDATRADRRKLSAFIDANNFASPKQREWIEKLVGENKIKAPKGFPDRIPAADAKTILDKAFSAKKGSKK